MDGLLTLCRGLLGKICCCFCRLALIIFISNVSQPSNINREIITSSAESKDGPEGGGLTVSCERQLKQMVSKLDTFLWYKV